MKITDKNFFGLSVFNQEHTRSNTLWQFVQQYSEWISKTVNEKQGKVVMMELALLLLDNKMAEFRLNPDGDSDTPEEDLDKLRGMLRKISHEGKTYLIKDEVQNNAKSLKLNNFKLNILKKLDTQKSTYIIDKDSFFRFYRLDNSIVGGYFQKSYKTEEELKKDLMVLERQFSAFRDENYEIDIQDFRGQVENGFDYYLFKLDLEDNKIEINDQIYNTMNDPKLKEDEEYPRLVQFIQLVTFVCLSDLEIRILAPNMKCSDPTSKFRKKIFNGSRKDVIVVGAKWNTISVRTEGFKVSGFFRLQPCGEGRKDVKLIFVDSFLKHGYVRKYRRKD